MENKNGLAVGGMVTPAVPGRSSVRYEPVEAANRAGKAALKQLLTEFPD